jgi:hypothetical protein
MILFLSPQCIIVFNDVFLSEVCYLAWFAEIYVRPYSERVVFGISNYSIGQKYYRFAYEDVSQS